MGAYTPGTRPPATKYAVTGVMPPAALAISTSDSFVVRIWNSAASINVRVVWRILLPDGTIVPNMMSLNPDATRAANIFSINLTDGFLLSVHVYTVTSGIKRGQCFVQVALHQDNLSNLVSAQLITEGYVTTGVSLTFPGGPNGYAFEGYGNIRSITGTQPAAGAEISETVPTGAVWRLVAIRLSFTASVAVANRTPGLQMTDGSNVLALLWSNFATAALGQHGYTFAENITTINAAFSESWDNLLFARFMLAGWKFTTTTVNIQAADQWAAPQYVVEEWMQP